MATRDDKARMLDALIAAVRASRITSDALVRSDLLRVGRTLQAVVGPTIPKRVAARQLGVSVQSIDAWIRAGGIPVAPGTGTRVELNRDDVVELALASVALRDEGRRRGVLAGAIDVVAGVRRDQQAVVDAIELSRFQTMLGAAS